MLVVLFNLFQPNTQRDQQSQMTYTNFLAEVEAGQVREVTIKGNQLTGKKTDGTPFVTFAPNDMALIDELRKANVSIQAQPLDDGSPAILSILQA